jgi:hypothetical protein
MSYSYAHDLNYALAGRFPDVYLLERFAINT